MVCIELALEYRHSGEVSLVPEPTGGEDANFVWHDGLVTTLEVQVKGAKGSAGLAELAEYLIHYPDRKSRFSLAERLMTDDRRFALFVLTARCQDQISPLLVTPPLARPTARPAPNSLASALRDEFSRLAEASPSRGASALEINRQKDVAKLAKRPVSDFERLLAKTSISDQQTAEQIEVRLHATMRSERFDTLSTRGILASLTDILTRQKRTQQDALALMLDELTKLAPSAVSPDGYVARGTEQPLIARLGRDRVLLLAGPPRAGKSWTARQICGELQTVGYEVRQGNHVDEADRFLTDATGAERVYMLDDPLGSRELASDANLSLATLNALCDRIPANRRLIVAQTEQVILQVRAAQTLDACSIGRHIWHRLETLPTETAQAVWTAAATIQNLPTSAVLRTTDLIEREPTLRDPGALVFLAQTWATIDANASDEVLLMQSRRDAQDFARMLAERMPEVRELLTASAIATTTADGAGETELAFIINGEDDRLSVENSNSVVVFGGKDECAPTYADPPKVSSTQQHALETLMRKRVIESRSKGINFSHPYLRAGAQALTCPDIPQDTKRIVDQIERAIACCSPATSLAAARNLRWLRRTLASSSSNAVFNVARMGIRSKFPATRDSCFEFLIESADAFPSEVNRELPDWSERMVFELADITVDDGVGFIPAQPDWTNQFANPSPLSDVKPYLDAIEDDKPLALDIALSRRLLLSLQDEPSAVAHASVRRFLSADEAVVRATAAGIWCRLPRLDDEDIIARIQADATPSVSVQLLRDMSGSWNGLDGDRQERILTVLSKHATSPACASVLFHRLVLFNRVEHFGENPPWRIFTKLMPIVIEHLPISVSFSNGRFDAVLESALEHGKDGTVAPLVEAWAKRISLRLDQYILDEYELSIVDALLDGVSSTARLPILQKLLQLPDTGAKIITVKRLAQRWGELDADERAILQGAVRQERIDQIWLAATVLTLSRPPEDLVLALTGDRNTLSKSPDEIQATLGDELFAACARMYVGHPQPLWWYATHHSQNPTWEGVIRHLAASPKHPLHPVGFYELASFGGPGELEDLIRSLPANDLKNAFKHLLDFKTANNGEWRSAAWDRLLTRGQEAGLLNGFLSDINGSLEGILERFRDIRLWLDGSSFETQIIDLLPNDLRALMRLHELQRILETSRDVAANSEQFDEEKLSSVQAALCGNLLTELEANPPRLHGSWSEISDGFKDMGADADTLSKIEEYRLTSAEQHNLARRSARGNPPTVELSGWIDQAGQEQ